MQNMVFGLVLLVLWRTTGTQDDEPWWKTTNITDDTDDGTADTDEKTTMTRVMMTRVR